VAVDLAHPLPGKYRVSNMVDHEDGQLEQPERLEGQIVRELPRLSRRDAAELASIVRKLVAALEPDRVYVFGSHARGDASPDSDVDLLVVVSQSDQPPHQRDQAALGAIGLHTVPLDVLVLTADEFEMYADSPSSLIGTIRREGRTLYPAA
jgi:uncharacterized protein